MRLMETNNASLRWVGARECETERLGCDGLDLEVHCDEGEHEALEVLDQVVEAAQPLGIPAPISTRTQITMSWSSVGCDVWGVIVVLGVVDVDERANLGRAERNVLLAQHNLELLHKLSRSGITLLACLAPHAVGLRPEVVVLLGDLRIVIHRQSSDVSVTSLSSTMRRSSPSTAGDTKA